jgi:hypothetical protein
MEFTLSLVLVIVISGLLLEEHFPFRAAMVRVPVK